MANYTPSKEKMLALDELRAIKERVIEVFRTTQVIGTRFKILHELTNVLFCNQSLEPYVKSMKEEEDVECKRLLLLETAIISKFDTVFSTIIAYVEKQGIKNDAINEAIRRYRESNFDLHFALPYELRACARKILQELLSVSSHHYDFIASIVTIDDNGLTGELLGIVSFDEWECEYLRVRRVQETTAWGSCKILHTLWVCRDDTALRQASKGFDNRRAQRFFNLYQALRWATLTEGGFKQICMEFGVEDVDDCLVHITRVVDRIERPWPTKKTSTNTLPKIFYVYKRESDNHRATMKFISCDDTKQALEFEGRMAKGLKALMSNNKEMSLMELCEALTGLKKGTIKEKLTKQQRNVVTGFTGGVNEMMEKIFGIKKFLISSRQSCPSKGSRIKGSYCIDPEHYKRLSPK